MSIEYTIVKPQRDDYDPDSALALCKPLCDGLVRGGLLTGDSDREVEYTMPVKQIYGPSRAVGITITKL
jgi:hypothetical protein